MRLRLIPDWKRAWRYFSVWAATALTLASLVQADVLPLFRFAIPAEKWPWVSACMGTLIIVLRMLSQTPPAPPAPAQPPHEAEGEQ